ncbi:hypothetical protein [Thermoactinomyces mirandus]|uniref:Uncharacterized protein n=1 Tax=Thermoactinomyces mirandus TaxID=2756294 RepID=A0A7W2ASB1_9BACL|nr:hypothetical protein [Thermoactinomyces mirandus]MBA4602495.1 hypothetical protein [Thermoactinomyces mirandus]
MIKQRTCLLVRETKRIFEEAGIKWHYINQWLPKSGLHDNWHFPSKIHKDSTSLQIKNRIFIEGFMGAKGFINRRRMENKYRTEMLKGE